MTNVPPEPRDKIPPWKSPDRPPENCPSRKTWDESNKFWTPYDRL